MRMLCLMIPDCHVCSIINYTRETFANQFRSVLEIYSCDARSFLKILRVIKQILFIREFLAAIAPEAKLSNDARKIRRWPLRVKIAPVCNNTDLRECGRSK